MQPWQIPVRSASGIGEPDKAWQRHGGPGAGDGEAIPGEAAFRERIGIAGHRTCSYLCDGPSDDFEGQPQRSRDHLILERFSLAIRDRNAIVYRWRIS
jgi:hypothetical protein